MSERTEVFVDSLRVSLTNQYRIILLKEVNGPLSLPLYIGQFEAEAVVLALQEIELSRPQTHDLFQSTVKALGGRIVSVEITEMKTATYYAEIQIIDADGGEVRIDCRPSDAIAVALRVHVPIYANRETLQQYGIMPEPDVRQKKQDSHTGSDSEDEDLSAFQDFFDNF